MTGKIKGVPGNNPCFGGEIEPTFKKSEQFRWKQHFLKSRKIVEKKNGKKAILIYINVTALKCLDD